MVDADDFVVRVPSDRTGWTKIHEYSAGGLVWSNTHNLVFLKSKNGSEKSFYVPKGHLKIINEFPEDIIMGGIRETREEMALGAEFPLSFNGFVINYQEMRDFEKSKEQSFKTIALVGLTLENALKTKNWQHEEKQVRGLTWSEVERYVLPAHLGQLQAYQIYLGSKGML